MRSAHSGRTRAPHAPWSRAFAANSPPSAFSPGNPTNRSPRPTSRESITARRGPSSTTVRGARCEVPAAAAAIHSTLRSRTARPQSRAQSVTRHGAVVERLLPPTLELLALLVALARDHDHVALAGALDRHRDRPAAVHLALRRGAGAGQHLVHDRVRVLRARV